MGARPYDEQWRAEGKIIGYAALSGGGAARRTSKGYRGTRHRMCPTVRGNSYIWK